MALLLALVLAVTAEAGNTSRPTGKGAVSDPSVYCQNWPGHSPRPEYQGTGPQTPCGPAFERAPPPPPPPPREPPVLEGRIEEGPHCMAVRSLGLARGNRYWLRSAHDLAVLVFSNYDTYPIYIGRIRRITGLTSPVGEAWIVGLSGLQERRFDEQTDEDTRRQQVMEIIAPGTDAYSRAVVEALAELEAPSEARLLLAGHSLGGMVAQDLVVNERSGFPARWPHVRVVTFGSPPMNAFRQTALRAATGRSMIPVTRFGICGDPVVVLPHLIFPQTFLKPGSYELCRSEPIMEWLGLAGATDFDWHNDYPANLDLYRYDAFGILQEGMDRSVPWHEIELDPGAQYRCSTQVLDEVIDDSIPPIENGAFERWFDGVSAADFARIWQDATARQAIQARLRAPGAMHEWLLVARADRFKAWGVRYAEIEANRTPVGEVRFVNPEASHWGSGGRLAHNQLLDMINRSAGYEDYQDKLRRWACARVDGGPESLPGDLAAPNRVCAGAR